MNKHLNRLYKIINWKHSFGAIALVLTIEFIVVCLVGLATPFLLAFMIGAIIFYLITWGLALENSKQKGEDAND